MLRSSNMGGGDMDTNVTICLPTNRRIRPKCFESLMKLVDRSKAKVIIGTKGFTTAENRTWMTVKAIKEGATHLMFVDDDMIYEPDTVERLLAHDKDIIGAFYANRRGEGDVGEALDEVSTTELFKAKAIGGGCTLIKAEVFKKLEQPWFWYKIAESGAITMSHDWYFCEKAREAGYDIWVDPTIRPGHLGQKEF